MRPDWFDILDDAAVLRRYEATRDNPLDVLAGAYAREMLLRAANKGSVDDPERGVSYVIDADAGGLRRIEVDPVELTARARAMREASDRRRGLAEKARVRSRRGPVRGMSRAQAGH